MKKLLAILLAAMMVFALVACGTNDNPSGNEDNPGVSQSGENNDNQSGEENKGNNDVAFSTESTAMTTTTDIPRFALIWLPAAIFRRLLCGASSTMPK